MSPATTSFGIIGTGSAVPAKRFPNDEFVKIGLDTSDEWITSRTGIKNRYIAESESTSQLAVEAAQKALKNAGLKPEDIDLIIVATSTPDHLLFPSVGCLVQRDLGCREVPAFDLSAACTGFIYALDVANQMMRSGAYKHSLVIGADTLSKFCNWDDRGTVVLFGDGAGAVVLGPVEKNTGILGSQIGSRGSGADFLVVPEGGSKAPLTEQTVCSPDRYIQMDGKAVYKFAVNIIMDVIETALQKCKLKKEDITFFIPHQANQRIIAYAQGKLGLSEEQVYVNIDEYGNTSAASIPIAIDEASRKGLLKPGAILVTVGFGAGLTYGANVMKWTA